MFIFELVSLLSCFRLFIRFRWNGENSNGRYQSERKGEAEWGRESEYNQSMVTVRDKYTLHYVCCPVDNNAMLLNMSVSIGLRGNSWLRGFGQLEGGRQSGWKGDIRRIHTSTHTSKCYLSYRQCCCLTNSVSSSLVGTFRWLPMKPPIGSMHTLSDQIRSDQIKPEEECYASSQRKSNNLPIHPYDLVSIRSWSSYVFDRLSCQVPIESFQLQLRPQTSLQHVIRRNHLCTVDLWSISRHGSYIWTECHTWEWRIWYATNSATHTTTAGKRNIWEKVETDTIDVNQHENVFRHVLIYRYAFLFLPLGSFFPLALSLLSLTFLCSSSRPIHWVTRVSPVVTVVFLVPPFTTRAKARQSSIRRALSWVHVRSQSTRTLIGVRSKIIANAPITENASYRVISQISHQRPRHTLRNIRSKSTIVSMSRLVVGRAHRLIRAWRVCHIQSQTVRPWMYQDDMTWSRIWRRIKALVIMITACLS